MPTPRCGRIRDELVAHYGSPFAVETAHVRLRHSDVVARIVRSLFDTARQYRESFEWQLRDGEQPVIHTAKLPEHEIPALAAVPDFADHLPEPIHRFTTGGVYDKHENQHLSFMQGGGVMPLPEWSLSS